MDAFTEREINGANLRMNIRNVVVVGPARRVLASFDPSVDRVRDLVRTAKALVGLAGIRDNFVRVDCLHPCLQPDGAIIHNVFHGGVLDLTKRSNAAKDIDILSTQYILSYDQQAQQHSETGSALRALHKLKNDTGETAQTKPAKTARSANTGAKKKLNKVAKSAKTTPATGAKKKQTTEAKKIATTSQAKFTGDTLKRNASLKYKIKSSAILSLGDWRALGLEIDDFGTIQMQPSGALDAVVMKRLSAL